jgi:hypothetical protein
METRHELMLSIIRDRITNTEKYKKEHYSKYGIDNDGQMDSKHGRYSRYGDDTSRVRDRIKGCNHEDTLEIRSALYTSPHIYNKGKITQEEIKREIEIQEQKTPEIKVKVKTKKAKAKQ